MWRDICLANRDRLLAELDALPGEARPACERLLEAGDGAALEKLFAEARAARDAMAEVTRAEAARAARAARCGCRARRASPTACCCSPRSRRARPRCAACSTPTTRASCSRRSRALGVALDERADGVTVRGAAARSRSRRPSCSSATPAPRCARSPPRWRFSGGEYRLSGVPRMHERPIGDLVDALRALGARIDYPGKDGLSAAAHPPGAIDAASAVRVRGDVSSQFLTALLMALPLAGRPRRASRCDGELISKPYVEITLNLMRRFGVEVERDGWRRFARARPAPYASPGQHPRRRRRLVGVVLPRRRRDRRRAGARRGRRAATASRATCASPTCCERWARRSPCGDDWIEVRRGDGRCRRSTWTATTSPTPR